jgi:eukaryotic-like serine/threonine-protein kinase
MDQNRHVEGMPQTIGRYQVQASIGFGAMGAVYKAFDPLIKRTLAIKTIRLDIPRGSPQYKSFLERFYHEARISGTLSHPNIVTLFDIGEEQGIPFLAMEYVEGETIASMIEKGVKFDPERVIGLVSQIGSAIDYAHSRGVIHRDIKPSNLILAEGDRVKVTDFGIAKLVDAEMTQSGALLGTPSYMSPEQAMGDKLDGRSDIFSLGICGFEMLSGEQPFPGNNVTSILYKLVHVDPVEPPNLEMNGLVPQKWHEVFGRVLAKKPDDRYQTATEFVQDLEYCLGSWFGAVPDEGGAPATVIMSAGAMAAAATPKANAPAARAAEPIPDATKAMPMPRTNTSPVPAVTPVSAPAEEKTVVMRAPAVAAAAKPVPAADSDDAATVMMKAPAPGASEPTARFPVPPAPPSVKPAPARARDTSPETAPVARPGASTPTTSAPPAARATGGAAKPASSSMLPLAIVGAVALLLMFGAGFVVWKLVFGRGTTTTDNPVTPVPTQAATAAPPTQAPTAEPTAAAPPGIINVESDPAGALIYVDNEAKGVTPTQLTGIALGSHEVRFDLAGYESKTETVELTAEVPEMKVTAVLAPPAPTSGSAEILSDPPGAAVAIGGKVVGTTPISDLSLKPGNYKVELRKEGFELFSMRLKIQPGQKTKLEAPLKAVMAATAPPTPKPEVAIDFDRVFEEREVDTAPRRIKGPSQPDIKTKKGESISVLLQWVVTETGDTVEYKILESGGKQADEAAYKMLRQQKYEPATKKGRPVKMRFEPRRFTASSG